MTSSTFLKTLVDTVIFHIYALTGEDARNVSRSGDVFQGFDIISGPLLGAFMFHQGEERAVILVDEFLQVRFSRLHIFTFRAYFGACRPMCIPIPTPTQKPTRTRSRHFTSHSKPGRTVSWDTRVCFTQISRRTPLHTRCGRCPCRRGKRYRGRFRRYVGLLRLLERFWGIGRRCISILIRGCLLSSPSYRHLLFRTRDPRRRAGYIWSIRQKVVSYTARVSLRVRGAVM